MKKEIDKALEVLSDEIIRLGRTFWDRRTRFETCTINAKNTDDTYDVRYQGRLYKTKVLNGIELKKGSTVTLCIPDNDIKRRFILGDFNEHDFNLTDSSKDSSNSEYLTKINPMGTGYFVMNRNPESEYTIGTNAFIEGNYCEASGNYSHVEGNYCKASGTSSHAEGNWCNATNYASHSEGDSTTASGYYSHSEGGNTKAIGSNSHAEGSYCEASGNASHSEGNGCKASGYCSHAEGDNTVASASYTHAEGEYSEASGEDSHAEGYYCKAKAGFSHCEGSHSTTNGGCSHAEGHGCVTYGKYSHAENYYSSTYGRCSHAEGDGSYAVGDASHIEGYGYSMKSDLKETITTITDEEMLSAWLSYKDARFNMAKGNYSHVEGFCNLGLGKNCHVEGQYNVSNADCQHVMGQYNEVDVDKKYVFIVGNGSYDYRTGEVRSNAHTLDWYGNAWYSGKGTFEKGIESSGDVKLNVSSDTNNLLEDITEEEINWLNSDTLQNLLIDLKRRLENLEKG